MEWLSVAFAFVLFLFSLDYDIALLKAIFSQDKFSHEMSSVVEMVLSISIYQIHKGLARTKQEQISHQQ